MLKRPQPSITGEIHTKIAYIVNNSTDKRRQLAALQISFKVAEIVFRKFPTLKVVLAQQVFKYCKISRVLLNLSFKVILGNGEDPQFCDFLKR